MVTTRVSIEDLLREAGARVTRPRLSVLRVLLEAPRALTHHEIARRVRYAHRVDRVTIYRVLDWLVAHRLAHRVASDDRVWRFNAAAEGAHADDHMHFKCSRCGGITCLEGTRASRRVTLPKGYRQQRMEITVKGLCAECAFA
ncbi:MAG TPA: transcriptional repressor [Burkholderiales bacterium]|nr:transcriptional repressor [Burkholderiales bacterium]